MATISIEDLFLITLVLVDDWYQQKGQYLLHRSVGSKPVFSDSEMLTLMLAIDFFEFTSERRYHAFIAANYGTLFPHLLDQSQNNRRARSLRYLLNELRQALPGLPKAGDASDFIAGIGDSDKAAERLCLMAEGSAEWTPPATGKSEVQSS